jgi:imidazolonepropionase-like amidohydrolase
MSKKIFFLLIILSIFGCKEIVTYDLAIKNVNVFDATSKQVLKGKTILINSDTIVSIVDSKLDVKAKKSINGSGKLATPGFVDTHIHLTDIYGGDVNSPEFLAKDSISIYRQKLADTYLKYGTTTIKVAGQPEKWIEPTIIWQQNQSPQFPDIFISGGALISDEARKTYMGHAEVMNPKDAANKVQTYYDLGIRHIKLYSRLRDPEFRAAFQKAEDLNMNICAHIENTMSIDTVLNIGLKHYEHLYTPLFSIFKYQDDWEYMYKFLQEGNPYDDTIFSNFFVTTLEALRFVNQEIIYKQKLDSLILKMGKSKVSCSSTIHLFAEKVGMTYFTNPIDTTDRHRIEPSKEQAERYIENFKILMEYSKKMHDSGIQLNIGTDCRYGGKAILSEMLLFYEAGFSIEDILKIATLNGAIAIDRESIYGSIETGKKANLVIFDKSPFDDYQNFLSDKVVIKDGKIYQD